MMNWTLARIAAVTQGRVVGGAQAEAQAVNGLTSDTRAIKQGQLFVALAGERFDAHDFLAAALQAGAAGQDLRPAEGTGNPEAPFLDIIGNHTRNDSPLLRPLHRRPGQGVARLGLGRCKALKETLFRHTR